MSISGASSILIRNNHLGPVAIASSSSGTITANDISAPAATALSITAAFTGSIDTNDIHGATIGVAYNASATLNANLHLTTTPRACQHSSPAPPMGFGFVGPAQPNDIYANTTGVNLTDAQMQNQHIHDNTIGRRRLRHSRRQSTSTWPTSSRTTPPA